MANSEWRMVFSIAARYSRSISPPRSRENTSSHRDEARATGTFRQALETGPADAGAPQRRGAAVLHHRWPVAGAVEIDRLKILVLLQPDAVQHVARQDRQAGAPGSERDRLADEVAD